MLDNINNLVSNYYKGEIFLLLSKLFSSVIIIGGVLFLRHYYLTDFVDYFSYDLLVICLIIIAKSVYQSVDYFYRRKRLLDQNPIDFDLEYDYVKKREAILTKHRRLHVYSVLFSLIGVFIVISNYNQSKQILALLIAILIVSTMLLSFSLFNSFRLSEYKFKMKNSKNNSIK